MMIDYGKWYHYLKNNEDFFIIIFEYRNNLAFGWRKDLNGYFKFGQDVGNNTQWSLSREDECEQPLLSIAEKSNMIKNIFEDLYI